MFLRQFNSLWLQPNKRKDIYRGTVTNYIANQHLLNNIIRIEVCGPEIEEGVYDSSYHPNNNDLLNFMRAASNNKIKEISFLACELDSESGNVIGFSLPANNSLEVLEVTSNQLGNRGLQYLLSGVAKNQSLKFLLCRSYNCQAMNLTLETVTALRQAILNNPTLTRVHLPDNELHEGEHLNYLASVYSQPTDHPLAVISGLSLRGSVSIPELNSMTAMSNEVAEVTRVKFMN